LLKFITSERHISARRALHATDVAGAAARALYVHDMQLLRVEGENRWHGCAVSHPL
jgi:hypothetical protein